MSKITYERRVGQEHPSIPLDWYSQTTGAVRDLSTGYTGTVTISHPDAPNDQLVSCSGVTLAATSPNYTLTISDTNYTDLVTAWGGTLPAYGEFFILTPLLEATSGGADDEWPGPKLVLHLKPAFS